MTECSVKGCEWKATETIGLAARSSVFQPLEYVLVDVEIDVPVCPTHERLLTTDPLQVYGPEIEFS